MNRDAPSSDSRDTPSGRRRRTRTQHRSASAHILDYLSVVRNHWFAAGLVFLLIFGWLLSRALLGTPVYETSATIQVDSQRGGSTGLLAELAPLERPSVTEAEIAVLLSYSLAREAAESRGLWATIEEVNAYRPLEVMLRGFQGNWAPCRLAVSTRPASEWEGSSRWTLRFADDGLSLQAWRGSEPKGEAIAPELTLGESFDDTNSNGVWDPPEPFEDLNGDGQFDLPEPYLDADDDGRWDPAEPFTDTNGNRGFDTGEPYEDRNGNGYWDPAEEFADQNKSGTYDDGDRFEDPNHNGRRDVGEPFEDRDGNGMYTPGSPLRLGENTVILNRRAGDPAGRTFHLTVRSLDATASLIRASVSAVEVAPWTGIVELKATAASPFAARNIANTVADAFLRMKQQRKELKAEKLLEWLLKEIERERKRLRELAQARLDYIEKAGAVRLGEQAQGVYEQQAALRGERFTLVQEEKHLKASLASLSEGQTTDALLTNVGTEHVDARTSAFVQSLADLRVERAVLVEEGAQPENQQLKLLDARIKITSRELDASVRSLVAQRRLEVTRALEGVQDLLDRVAEDEQRLATVLAELPGKERKLLELAGPIQASEASLEPLTRWQQEAEIARASAVSSVYLVDSARLQSGRKSPGLFRSGLMALVLGFVGAMGIAFLLEHLDRKIKTPQVLEDKLGLPIVVSIPAYDTVRRKHRGHTRGPLVAQAGANSVLAEAYRTMRANIRYAHSGSHIRTLAITSSMQQEGKTITTLNLAAALAQGGASVVVVDADLRRPATHKVLGGEQEPGLVGILRGEQRWTEVVRKTEIEGLDLIAAGRRPENPGRLLDSRAFDTLLEELQSQYEYVMFDVPPVLAVADAAAFFRKLDAVYLLVRFGRYGIDVAEGAQDQLERLGANVLGVVFNGFDARRASRYGRGYYGYYGHYTRYAADDA